MIKQFFNLFKAKDRGEWVTVWEATHALDVYNIETGVVVQKNQACVCVVEQHTKTNEKRGWIIRAITKSPSEVLWLESIVPKNERTYRQPTESDFVVQEIEKPNV